MKKVAVGLAAVLLIVMQMTAVAYALNVNVTAAEGLTVTGFDASGAQTGGSESILDPAWFRISYESSDIQEGEQYVILLAAADLSGSEPVYDISDDSSILYINQTAGSAGSVLFEKVYPTEIRDCVVLLSGAGLESPFAAGTIKISDEETPAVKFVDVPDDAYYAAAVDWAVKHNITKGTSETTFSPTDPCIRAQVVTFLSRAYGGSDWAGSELPFTDVVKGSYYYSSVGWAAEQGITKGTSETTFGPQDPCTRGQVVTFLYRAAGSPEFESADVPFTDVNADAFYYNAMQWAVANGITKGTSDTTFSPGQTCTRAQIVTFLYRALEQAE